MKSYNWDPETQFFGYTIGFSITADLPSSPWLENNSQTANLQVTCWWRPPSHRFSVLYLLSLLYELKKKYEIFIFLKKSEKNMKFWKSRGGRARANANQSFHSLRPKSRLASIFIFYTILKKDAPTKKNHCYIPQKKNTGSDIDRNVIRTPSGIFF